MNEGDRRPRRLTYANVTATLALFVALGGGAYAALKLPANSVGTKQLKDAAVGVAEIKPGARDSLRGATGPSGPQGPQGPRGPEGSAAPVDPDQTTERRVFATPGAASTSIPAGTDVTIELWGAGGGGGGFGPDVSAGGGGGGSGAYSRVAFSTASDFGCDVSVGAGGAAGGVNVSGANGGASTVQCSGVTAAGWSALGGGGGITGNLLGPGAGGAGAAGAQSPAAPYLQSAPGALGGARTLSAGGDPAAPDVAGHGGRGGGAGQDATAGGDGRVVFYLSPAP